MERSGLYGFLASIFRTEPTEAVLRRMKEPSFQEALNEAFVNLDDDFHDATEADLAEALAVEFAALFLGPGGHVSPHESVHTKGGGQLLGNATSAVKNYIEACGFEYDPDHHVLPDHISVELEFMAEVTRQEALAWQEKDLEKVLNCLEYESEFIERHLSQWVPVFCNKVLERAQLSFYRCMAEITRNFMDTEIGEIDRRRMLAEPCAG